jgi:hypothetical protein
LCYRYTIPQEFISISNALYDSVRQSLATGFWKIRANRSVFYSLAPGLGKRRAMLFLRNDCRQFRGDRQLPVLGA